MMLLGILNRIMDLQLTNKKALVTGSTAGIGFATTKLLATDEWFEIFEVNVMSGIRLARHYFPKMLEKNEGRIIFISSESAMNIPTEMIHYGMTKTAQLSISTGLQVTMRLLP